MKYWMTILISLFISSLSYTQSELLQSLLQARESIETNQCPETCRAIAKLNRSWQSNGKHYEEDQTMKYGINNHLQKISNPDASRDARLKSVETIITTLHEYRKATQSEVPFDELWEAYLAYIEIKETVNDQMMNLKEWFEFDDQINKFICEWDDYDLLDADVMRRYHPQIDPADRKDLGIKMQECLDTFMKSVESGFRPDFVLPCDDIGRVLEDSLNLFAQESKVG